jgi:hypothetical protein
MPLLGAARAFVNRLLKPLRVELVRTTTGLGDHDQYIPFQQTLAGAKAAGLTVGDYIDQKHNVAGATHRAIDEMRVLGVFDGPVQTICEIGPGSGRYLSKTLEACRPSHYEIYETARPWAEYLVREYKVLFRPTDGRSLSHTPTASVNLVHAHKVFVVTPWTTTCSYFLEMIRVTVPGGFIVFDCMTEPCLEAGTLEGWISWGSGYYPCLFPRGYLLQFFESRGCSLVGSFFEPMKPGKTETFVFRKSAAPGVNGN